MMVRLFCAYCGDRLRPVTVATVKVGPLRADWRLSDELRHATRRTMPDYRPDTITAARIWRRFTLARARNRFVGFPWGVWYGIGR